MMAGQSYRAQVVHVAHQLRELHRVLIAAARRQYEQACGPMEGSYALLEHLAHNPTFAWLTPLTALVSDLDSLLEHTEISAADAAAVHLEATLLIEPVEGGEMEFEQQLRHARSAAPELVVVHAHARAALAALPPVDPTMEAALRQSRATWGTHSPDTEVV